MPGTLFVVATPIGNLEDVTARALRVLREAALIAAEDTRRTAHLLARYAIVTPTTSLHEHNERRRVAGLVERLLRGDDIALVSDAGTPTISDPGQQLIQAAIDAGVRVEPIPGPSAVAAALAASGMPADTYLFLGFPPVRSKDRAAWFEAARTAGRTVVFFEAPHRIQATLEEFLRLLGDCRVCIARELTKAHETLVRGPISESLAALVDPRGEFTVVVDIGRMPETAARHAPTDADIVSEFGVMTKSRKATRRQAISALARKHGMSAKTLYQMLERSKSSGE